MTVVSTIQKAAADIKKEAPKLAKEKAEEKRDDIVQENTIGLVCTWMFSSEKGRNRCKAADKLYSAAKDTAAAVPTCTAAVASDAATPATGGLAAPAGAVTSIECAGNVLGAGDNLQAGLRQLWTGEETPTYTDKAKDYLLDKVKEAGAVIKKKVKDEVDRQIQEAASSDYRHFKELNPDATPSDYNQLQDMQDNPFQ